MNRPHSWEVKAGWKDAIRTRHARPHHGIRWGGPDYAIGYAAGATLRAAVRLALRGARR